MQDFELLLRSGLPPTPYPATILCGLLEIKIKQLINMRPLKIRAIVFHFSFLSAVYSSHLVSGSFMFPLRMFYSVLGDVVQEHLKCPPQDGHGWCKYLPFRQLPIGCLCRSMGNELKLYSVEIHTIIVRAGDTRFFIVVMLYVILSFTVN